MTRKLIALCVLSVALSACGKSDDAPEPADESAAAPAAACPQENDAGVVEIQEGLTATILSPGYGRRAVSKDYADVHTTLWLYDENAEGGKGTEIWSSGGSDPFQFQIDSGQVIAGWDLGVKCMKIGETRQLKIASELGYGARGKPPVPPNATLLFEIKLIKLESPE